MNLNTSRILLLGAVLAVAFDASAQEALQVDPAIAAIEFPPRYQVELVIFMNLQPSPGNESFAARSNPMAWEVFPDEPEPVDEEIVDEETLEPLADTEEEVVRRRPTEIVVDPEQWQLTKFADRIKTSRDYRLLSHQAWRQDGLPSDEAVTFFILPATTEDGLLEGSATLSVGRYPHLKLDLRWLPGGYQGSLPLYPDLSDLRDKPVPYSINQSSRVTRTGVPHYFDHPHFGVIATVSAVEEIELDEFGNPVVPDEEPELTGSRR